MRVGAVIAAAGKSGGYKSYEKMKSVDGIQVLRQMILNFKRAGVDEIVLITGYQAEQVEKKLAKLGAVFLRSEDYEKEEMITSAVRGMNYLNRAVRNSSSDRQEFLFSQKVPYVS